MCYFKMIKYNTASFCNIEKNLCESPYQNYKCLTSNSHIQIFIQVKKVIALKGV